DVLVQRALAEGKTAPKFHALTRPARAEAEATHRAIALAEIADVPVYIVHLSSAEALEMVTEARDRGLPAYAETCPQYLFLSYDNYEEPDFGGAKYVMSPPLREKAKQDRLWRGLAFNALQALSTDHCPFCMKEQKELGRNDFSKIPNGAPGIETRMSLVYDGGVRAGRISLNRFVELTSTSPAKIFGLFPRKGTIAPGSDADIVVFDPNRTQRLSAKTLHMKVDYNPYEGREVTGVTETVISRGKVIVDGERFTGGGAEANENAIKIARAVTGRQKILARYRSYHGGTAAAIAATGDPRGWSQPPLPGIVHVLDPYHGVARGWDNAATSLKYLEEVIQLEGPHTIAAFILETVTGTNGVLVPPDGYMQGVRALCDKHGILMIADEVMSGFGRTGKWFA